ncbi:8-oxo-dGTP pyrophosphatase MutT (NUDIX family) [Marmoricola sp. URHA0025 HA25]
MSDEPVALVDESGRVVGSAPRSVVRRDNLRHAATAVLVRDPARRIYLHRRTDTKDWAPGHWDAAAGGVIAVGEEPHESALREVAEELGITGAVLTALGDHLYEDETTRCFEHAYETVWDGPVVHQPEEVAEGRWVTLAELATLLADPEFAFVPDTRQLLGQLAARAVGEIHYGRSETGASRTRSRTGSGQFTTPVVNFPDYAELLLPRG